MTDNKVLLISLTVQNNVQSTKILVDNFLTVMITSGVLLNSARMC